MAAAVGDAVETGVISVNTRWSVWKCRSAASSAAASGALGPSALEQ
jgi:hypothetical protein